jgi:hypothetical protein
MQNQRRANEDDEEREPRETKVSKFQATHIGPSQETNNSYKLCFQGDKDLWTLWQHAIPNDLTGPPREKALALTADPLNMMWIRYFASGHSVPANSPEPMIATAKIFLAEMVAIVRTSRQGNTHSHNSWVSTLLMDPVLAQHQTLHTAMAKEGPPTYFRMWYDQRTTTVPPRPSITPCPKCGRLGHPAHLCRSDHYCNNCKMPGHRTEDCRKRYRGPEPPRPTTNNAEPPRAAHQ